MLIILKEVVEKFARLNQVLGLIGGALILITSILITYEVIMRYLLSAAPSWTNDVSRYFLLLIAFLPVAYTLQQKDHINVDLIVSKVNKTFQTLLDIVSHIAIILFSSIVIWVTFDYFEGAIIGGRMTQGNFMIPSSWLYGVMLFGFILLIVVSLIRILEKTLKQNHLTSIQKSKNE